MNTIILANVPTREQLTKKHVRSWIVRGKTVTAPVGENGFERFRRLAVKKEGCWGWLGHVGPDGYGIMGALGKQYKAHRISASIHFGSVPKGMMVLHRCDNRICTNPDHLYIGTSQDNVDDMMSRNRKVTVASPGEASGTSKLTNADVVFIRAEFLYPRRGLQASLSRKFSVAPNTIFRIVNRITWGHL